MFVTTNSWSCVGPRQPCPTGTGVQAEFVCHVFSLRSEFSQNLHALLIKDRRCVVFGGRVLEWRVRTKGMWPGHPPSAEEPLLVFCCLKIFEEALSKMRGV